MPFTPFHFGPALLVKAVAPRHVSLSAFVATQVAIDFESLYHLIRHEWPVHTVMHTLLGSTATGLATGLSVAAAGPVLRRLASARFLALTDSQGPKLLSEVSLGAALVGGILGGLSHSVLDSIVHSDVRPFWPFAHGTFFGIIGAGNLHVACVVSGFIGLGVLIVGNRRRLAV